MFKKLVIIVFIGLLTIFSQSQAEDLFQEPMDFQELMDLKPPTKGGDLSEIGPSLTELHFIGQDRYEICKLLKLPEDDISSINKPPNATFIMILKLDTVTIPGGFAEKIDEKELLNLYYHPGLTYFLHSTPSSTEVMNGTDRLFKLTKTKESLWFLRYKMITNDKFLTFDEKTKSFTTSLESRPDEVSFDGLFWTSYIAYLFALIALIFYTAVSKKSVKNKEGMENKKTIFSGYRDVFISFAFAQSMAIIYKILIFINALPLIFVYFAPLELLTILAFAVITMCLPPRSTVKEKPRKIAISTLWSLSFSLLFVDFLLFLLIINI